MGWGSPPTPRLLQGELGVGGERAGLGLPWVQHYTELWVWPDSGSVRPDSHCQPACSSPNPLSTWHCPTCSLSHPTCPGVFTQCRYTHTNIGDIHVACSGWQLLPHFSLPGPACLSDNLCPTMGLWAGCPPRQEHPVPTGWGFSITHQPFSLTVSFSPGHVPRDPLGKGRSPCLLEEQGTGVQRDNGEHG